MTSVSSPGSLSRPSTNTEVLVKLWTAHVWPSSILNLGGKEPITVVNHQDVEEGGRLRERSRKRWRRRERWRRLRKRRRRERRRRERRRRKRERWRRKRMRGGG